MSSILYYSNFCEHSKKLIKFVSSQQFSKNIHFICIDKRTRGQDGKIYIVLENSQQIVLPENITRVPAVLLLNENYKVLYGDDIYKYFNPKVETATRKATQNNMEPIAFSFDGYSSVSSDQYSFWDMSDSDLQAKGNGGMRQMHNYVALDYVDKINTPTDDFNYKASKSDSNLSIEQIQSQRDQDTQNIQYITR